MITNQFDNNCAACGGTAWAGEKVYYNPHAPRGQKIRHAKCGDFDRDSTTVVETKTCGRCKVEKPLSDYHKSSKNKGGLQGYCKTCNKEANAEYAERRIRAKIALEQLHESPSEPVAIEGNEAIANRLGISVQQLLNMPFGQVAEYLAMADRLDNLRKGVIA